MSARVIGPVVTEVNGVDKSAKDPVILLNGHEKEVYACSWNPAKDLLVSGYVSFDSCALCGESEQ